MVACDYPQCKREWVGALLATQSLAVLTTSLFIVSPRLRRFDGAAAVSDVVLPGLRAACAEGRDFGPKKESAMRVRMIRVDDFTACSFVTPCFRMCTAFSIDL
jgi:hypothetical protein